MNLSDAELYAVGSDHSRSRSSRRGPDQQALEALISIDAGEAREILHRLRNEGFREQRGRGGGASYRLSGSLCPLAGLRLSPDELGATVL